VRYTAHGKGRETSRLFFGLLPGAEAIRSIQFHVDQCSEVTGKKVIADNFHITLLFLGNIENSTINNLCAECDNISASSIELTINEAGFWSKPGILWLGPEIIPAELLSLVGSLRKIARDRKLNPGKNKYHPHITLMRKVLSAPQQPIVKPFNWHAGSFSLVKSHTHPDGVQYQELASWPLL